MRLSVAMLALVLLASCSKAEPAPASAPPAAASALAAPVPSTAGSTAVEPSASLSVAVAAATVPVAPVPVPVPVPVPPRAPSAVASSVVPAPSVAASAAPAPAPKPVSAHQGSAHWSIDFSSPGGCTAGGACTAQLRIEALGDFHVNPEYRFRFVPGDAPGLAFTGGAPGDFALQGPKVGVLALGFRPSSAGTATLAGTFKICVCTDSECQPEQVSVSLAVPVAAQP